MNEDATLNLILAIGLLVLVVSALAGRRPNLRMLIQGLIQWTLIFGILFVTFAYRDDLNLLWQRIVSEWGPERMEVAGGTVRVRPQDGHYFVTADVNGEPLRFLIDTGATLSAIGTQDAAAVGIQASEFAFPVAIQTANGTISARRAVADRVEVGPIKRQDFTVLVSPTFDGINVLGMNFLSSLKGWRVESGVLILEG